MDAKQTIQAYQHVFSGPMGEAVYNDLMDFCGVKRISFSKDPGVMAFNEGMRNVGLRVQAMLEAEAVQRPAKVKNTDPI